MRNTVSATLGPMITRCLIINECEGKKQIPRYARNDNVGSAMIGMTC